MRADVFLFSSGLAKSRSHAVSLLNDGVCYKGVMLKKSSLVPDDADIKDFFIAKPSEFVGRGGIKLKAALEAFGTDVSGMLAVDIGASTGGFTDCLLSRGVRKV